VAQTLQSSRVERSSAKGVSGKVALVLVSLLVGVGIGWAANTQTNVPGNVSVQASGPHHIEAGVPVGYAQTRAGAIAAASNFAMVRTGPLLADLGQYETAISRMAYPTWHNEGIAGAEKAHRLFVERFRLGTPGTSLQSSGIRYRLDKYSNTSAAVSVLSVALVQQSDGQLIEIWGAEKYGLRWSSNDWRVASASSIDGVVPTPFEAPTASQDALGRLKGFKPYEFAQSTR
jgi:hypothetical protein